MSNLPISSPAGFVPPFAVTFSDAGGGSVTASATNPLPVVLGGTPSVTLGGSLVLGAGGSTIGAISNSSFAISGTLPGFASPPTVNATQNGAWNIANITGTVPLPTGAATAAQLTQISGQLPATLGAKTTANALAVTIASDQGAVPVVPTQALAASSAPLAGAAATTATVGPFMPQLGRELRLKLWGTWAGSVQVLSSADAGTTKLPITASGGAFALFTTNCNETVDSPSDSADKYYLAITVASGTVNYRLAQ